MTSGVTPRLSKYHEPLTATLMKLMPCLNMLRRMHSDSSDRTWQYHLIQVGKTADAINFCKQLLDHESDASRAVGYFYWARALKAEGLWNEAEAKLQEWQADLSAYKSMILTELASVYHKRKEFAKGLELIEVALSHNSQWSHTYDLKLDFFKNAETGTNDNIHRQRDGVWSVVDNPSTQRAGDRATTASVNATECQDVQKWPDLSYYLRVCPTYTDGRRR